MSPPGSPSPACLSTPTTRGPISSSSKVHLAYPHDCFSMFTFMFTFMHTSMYTFMFTFMYTSMYTSMYASMFTSYYTCSETSAPILSCNYLQVHPPLPADHLQRLVGLFLRLLLRPHPPYQDLSQEDVGGLHRRHGHDPHHWCLGECKFACKSLTSVVVTLFHWHHGEHKLACKSLIS